jgi:hypothetical protein
MYKKYDENSFHELKKYYWKANPEEKLAIRIYTYTDAAKIINDILRYKKPINLINLGGKILENDEIKTIISILDNIESWP